MNLIHANHHTYIFAIVVFLMSYENVISQNTPEHDVIISVERIWDRAAHNAFTGLIEFNDKLYCTFRESNGHVSDINGTIRVIASDNGQNWYSVAHIFEQGVDLRDPQLSVTPDNRIMLNIAGSVYTNGKLEGMLPKVSFSDNAGMNFSVPQNIVIDENIKSGKDWLWRATWNRGKSYATIYQPAKEKPVQLVVSDDGINYSFITTFDVTGGNETTLRFDSKNRMIAVVRRDQEQNGYIGVSDFPYKSWGWNELESRLGGPDLILLEDGNMLCATREYPPDRNEKTIIAKVDLDGGFTKLLTLPSGGDCSYPGFVLRGDILYISYYSSHEEKTAIYLAKILDLSYGYDSFERVVAPTVVSDKNGIVGLSCADKQGKIIYTLDGSIPTALNGYAYSAQVAITKTSLLRAVAIKDRTPVSKVLTQNVGTDLYQKSQVIDRKLTAGLAYDYYEGKVRKIHEITSLTKSQAGVVPNITTSPKMRGTNYGFIYSGYIKIQKDGVYTFYLSSNDGSGCYLNDELAINNDGPHGNREESVVVSLSKGYHKLSLLYFQLGGGQNLILEWSGEDFGRIEIPASVYFH